MWRIHFFTFLRFANRIRSSGRGRASGSASSAGRTICKLQHCISRLLATHISYSNKLLGLNCVHVTDWRRREGEKLTLTSLTSSWRRVRGWGSAVPGWRQPLIRRIRVRFAEFITWWFGGVFWNTPCRPTLSTWPGCFVRGFIATNRDTETHTLFKC